MLNRNIHKDEVQSFLPWQSIYVPRKVLLIRMHAIGDVALTLPALTAFRARYPDTRIDFLTSRNAFSLIHAVESIDNVYSFLNYTSAEIRAVHGMRWGAKIRQVSYDVIIDLQRNRLTRLIRRIASPASWGEFDRFALKPAGRRVIEAFHNTGFTGLLPKHNIPIKVEVENIARNTLADKGWDDTKRLVVLNPAGLWKTRQWPIDNYVEVARMLMSLEPVRFLILGTSRIRDKSAYLEKCLGNCVINLVNETSLGEAFAILLFASLVLSEDSGLMHMAWVSGIPTIALFGSSNHVWSSPEGFHTRCFHSGDLTCGACMDAKCRYGDVHCLTRYSPTAIFEEIQVMLKKVPEQGVVH